MYCLNSCYYNPEWGRFINAYAEGGKVGDLLSHNVFAYCMNNPVNLEDPSGNWPKLGKILKIAAIVAVVAIAVVCIVQPELIPIAANAVIDAYYYAGAVYTTAGWKAAQVVSNIVRGTPKSTSNTAQAKTPATVNQLVDMMNKRPKVEAKIATGDALEYLQKIVKADGSHMLMEDGTSSILLRPEATRWTAYHELLHRCMERNGGGYTPGADEKIESFLGRHVNLFKLN